MAHTLISAFLVLWALAYAGLVVFSFHLASPGHWSKLVADGRIKAEYAEYILGIPGWVVVITYLAAITRLGGAIALAASHSWALPFFSLSLFFVVIIMYRGFFVAKVSRVIRPSQIVLEIAFLLISIAATFYAYIIR